LIRVIIKHQVAYFSETQFTCSLFGYNYNNLFRC